MRPALSVVGWVVIAGLALLLLDIWLGPLRPELIALVGLSPWLLLAAWPIAGWSLATRRWPLAAAAVVVVALQLLVLLPSFAPWQSPQPAVAGTTFTVYDQNVKVTHRDLSGVGRQIATARPDVVVLEEVSRTNYPSLQATGVLDRYPHTSVDLAGSRGFAIFSTLPLTDVTAWQSSRAEQVQAVLTMPGGARATLLLVHTVSPTSGRDVADWDRDMTAIAARVRATPGPVLVVGDLNATPPMRQLRRVLGAGLRDGAAMNGDGWRMTWPNGRPLLPRVFRLDHVLVSSELTVPSYRVGKAAGSDHSPMIFTVGRTACAELDPASTSVLTTASSMTAT